MPPYVAQAALSHAEPEASVARDRRLDPCYCESLKVSAITIELPPGLLREVERFAQREGLSASEFVAAAAAEKVNSIGLQFLRAEAAQGKIEDWKRVLSQVPNRPPVAGDEL